MIAVDTNLLVYSHREEMQWHEAARDALQGLVAGAAAWAIPWPCVHEFFAVVTHPRVFDPPTPRELAVETVAGWLESASLVLLAEAGDYFAHSSRAHRQRAGRRPEGARRAHRRAVPPARRPRALERRPRLQPVSVAAGPESAARVTVRPAETPLTAGRANA